MEQYSQNNSHNNYNVEYYTSSCFEPNRLFIENNNYFRKKNIPNSSTCMESDESFNFPNRWSSISNQHLNQKQFFYSNPSNQTLNVNLEHAFTEKYVSGIEPFQITQSNYQNGFYSQQNLPTISNYNYMPQQMYELSYNSTERNDFRKKFNSSTNSQPKQELVFQNQFSSSNFSNCTKKGLKESQDLLSPPPIDTSYKTASNQLKDKSIKEFNFFKPSLSSSTSLQFTFDPLLLNTLTSPSCNSGRLLLLKIEKKIEVFLENSNLLRIEFPPMSSYHRLLLHRVAEYFDLDHVVDGSRKCIVFYKNKNSDLPVLRFQDLIEQEKTPQKTFQIMRRQKKEKTPSSSKNINFYGVNSSDEKTVSSYEEREKAYQIARNRIFQVTDEDSINNEGKESCDNNQSDTKEVKENYVYSNPIESLGSSKDFVSSETSNHPEIHPLPKVGVCQNATTRLEEETMIYNELQHILEIVEYDDVLNVQPIEVEMKKYGALAVKKILSRSQTVFCIVAVFKSIGDAKKVLENSNSRKKKNYKLRHWKIALSERNLLKTMSPNNYPFISVGKESL